MSKKDAEVDLMQDATKAEDLKGQQERTAEQLAHLGGEVDDIDNFDPTGLDDGSDPDYKAPDPEEEKDDGKKDEELDAEKDSEGEEGDGEAAEGDGADSEDEGADKGDSDDSEGSEEASEDDAGEDKGDAEEGKKGIPKHRFDDVNDRMKAAERENEELKRQIEAGKPSEKEEDKFDIDAAEDEYSELLLDGKVKEAGAKRREIRAAEKAEIRAELATETKASISDSADAKELNALSGEAKRLYPCFDKDHEDFDRTLSNKVSVYYQGYLKSGQAASHGDAFVLALADVIESADLDEKYGEKEPEPELEPELKPTGEKKVDKKKEELREKALTPVVGEGASGDDAGASNIDIDQMTDEEMDALPKKTLARLRGDIFDG